MKQVCRGKADYAIDFLWCLYDCIMRFTGLMVNMKRDTALKNTYKLIQRIKSINGILSTPLANVDYIKIKRAWLFGSVLKGSENPNDVDIFIELEGYTEDHRFTTISENPKYVKKSRRKRIRPLRDNRIDGLHGGYRFDRNDSLFKSCGMRLPISSADTLNKWLRKHMHKVSIHYTYYDQVFHDLDQKCLIYPRCDFDFENVLTKKFKQSLATQKRLP